MSLYRRGGMWWSRIIVNGAVHQFTTHTTNKNLARTVEANKRTDIIKGLVKLTAPTLREFGIRFLESLPGRVAGETVRFYRCHWRPLVGYQPLADKPLDTIDARLVDDFTTWRRKTVGTVAVNQSLRTLRRALHKAVEWDLIARVPTIRLPPDEPAREYVLSDDVVDRFGDQGLMGKIVPFLVDTGLRRREISELTWANVNLTERYIQVSRSKSKAGRRKIPLTKRAERILIDLVNGSGPVFSLNGRRLTVDWLSHKFLDARRALGLPDEAVLHSTRHTFCTRLGERGADAFEIQRLAGHSSIAISQKYVHPSRGRLDRAIALLD